jgi:hypothetical protein
MLAADSYVSGGRSEAAQESDAALPYPAERKLVKKAAVRIRVEDPVAADKSIAALMEKHGAYAASTEVGENTRYYNIRVPGSNYDAFLADMDGMGRTLSRSESAEDVTLRYYDLEGRLATKRELLKTFQSYLGRAKNIEEILSVEKRIAELQSEIDWTGNELRNLANLADYAAISLDITGPAGERVRELFGGFGSFCAAAAAG